MKIFNNIKRGVVRFTMLVLPMMIIASSCGDDFLNYPSETSIPEENVFDTPARILSQVNGLYGSAKNGALFGGRYHIYNDIRGEEFRNRTSNVVTGFSTYQFTNDPSDTYIGNFWAQGYLTINRVNKFLNDFDSHSGVVTEAVETNYRAEAKFIRGLTYFGLIQLFGAKPYTHDNGASRGIPLRLQPQTTSANNDMAASTVAQIYTQILADLNDAETGLPDNYSSASLNTTRAHKNTAIALKARVYMAMGRFEDVITEANKIVPQDAPFQNATRVAHALQADVVNAFRTPFTTSENVFSFPMAITNVPGTQNQLAYYYNAGNIEYFINTSAPGIFSDSAWPTSDRRKSGLTATRTAAPAGQILIKWTDVSTYIDWVPMIRYAEVLLNLAEAEAALPTGDLARAEALVKTVRSRSDADYTFPGVDFSDRAQVLEAIYIEKRIEFLGEGFRATDTQRRLESMASVGAGASIPVTDSRYTFPIPLAEVLTNSLIE